MTSEEIKGKVIGIVADQLDVPKEQVTLDKKFTDLGADSLDQAEMVMELEDEFDINVPDDAERKIKTVGDTVNYIEQELKRRTATA
jgi:acyl carrier protein